MRSKKVEPKVEKILKDDQKFRDSDKRLLMEYWERFDGLRLSPEQRATFMRATPAESITRARRELKVKYPASETIDNARYGRYVEERDSYGQPIMVFRKG